MEEGEEEGACCTALQISLKKHVVGKTWLTHAGRKGAKAAPGVGQVGNGSG